MNEDSFQEYKYIIQGALDFVKFGDRVDIIKSDDTICIFPQRTNDIAVCIVPRGPEFNIMYFACGLKNNADVLNLAAPDSIQTLGELIRGHLAIKYGRS